MHYLSILAAFIIGLMLAIHLCMNAAVGTIIRSAPTGNAVFWWIGAAAATLIWIVSPGRAAIANVSSVTPWLWLAGVSGASLVFGMAAIIPRLGAGNVFIITLTGQVIASLLISHYGLLGSPQSVITLRKIIGALIMVAGATLAIL